MLGDIEGIILFIPFIYLTVFCAAYLFWKRFFP